MIEPKLEVMESAYTAFLSVIPYATEKDWKKWLDGRHPRSGIGLSKSDRLAFICHTYCQRHHWNVEAGQAYAAGWFAARAKQEVDEQNRQLMIGD